MNINYLLLQLFWQIVEHQLSHPWSPCCNRHQTKYLLQPLPPWKYLSFALLDSNLKLYTNKLHIMSLGGWLPYYYPFAVCLELNIVHYNLFFKMCNPTRLFGLVLGLRDTAVTLATSKPVLLLSCFLRPRKRVNPSHQTLMCCMFSAGFLLKRRLPTCFGVLEIVSESWQAVLKNINFQNWSSLLVIIH